MNKIPQQDRVIMLIAPEFDEEAVVHCLYQLRRRGMAVILVGTPANLVFGASGLAVHPDYSLTQLHQAVQAGRNNVLIIPGGSACATTLLSDPRVHRAIRSIFIEGGSVAAMSPIVPQILMNIGLLEPSTAPNFLAQGTLSTADFTKVLINHIVA